MAFITLLCVFYLATFLLLVILQTPLQKKTTSTEEGEEEEEQLAASPSNSVSSSTDPNVLERLKEIACLVEEGGNAGEVRKIAKAVRLTMGLRRKLINASVLSSFLNYVSAGSYQLNGDDEIIQVDAAKQQLLLPELEIYCYLLLLIHLIDQGKYTEAKDCSSASIARLKLFNKTTIDVLASKIYHYYSLSHELTGHLSHIRRNLLNLHHIATQRNDKLGQETLCNLLLRNYLHYNLYDQAEKFRSKAPHFESQSNPQFCRYLFYLGKIRTIQLEYTDAKECFLQAAQRAPVSTALGFRAQCIKWAVLVHLLLGEIPERTVFMQKGLEKALRPYFELTNAVRVGDLELFRAVAEKFSSTFSNDRTNNVIVRLRHSVIRTALRNISISYSRISLADVAEKLRLDSENAESIIAKAVRDGAIDAMLDHANGTMICKEKSEPLMDFDSRINLS
ncbi:hypothetical protein DM860_003294 [Cuscuta australis]|uniref:PCI domain-containing protein n=1 Tax=Cuscuta australis TaxID=267555 RepID=A0A328D600_9ASTE|nr:hypothetical protein DM860_003294 [Cuscuta australis]